MSIKIPSVRLMIAGGVAVAADILQWLLIPAFSELGFMSPVNDILDMAVAGVMVSLLGFHWVFVPSAIGKLVPGVDMMPFWSGAVFFVAMGQSGMATGQPGVPNPQELPSLNPTQPQVALPSASNAATQSSAQTAQSLHPFFREIDSK